MLEESGITMNRIATSYYDDPIFPGPLPAGKWRVITNMSRAIRATRVYLSNSSNNTNKEYLCSISRAGFSNGDNRGGNYHTFVINTTIAYTYVIVENLESDNEIRFSIHFSAEPNLDVDVPPIEVPPIEFPPVELPDFEIGERRDMAVVINTPLYSPYTSSEVNGISTSLASISYLTYFSYIYRFWRGSVRYKMISYRSGAISTLFGSRLTYLPSGISEIPPIDGGTTLNVADDIDFNAGTTLVKTPVSNVLEVTWPYYNQHLCEVVGSEDTFRTNTSDNYSSLTLGAIQERYAINDELVGSVLHSAGDDFEYGFLIPPPTFLKTNFPARQPSSRKIRVRARSETTSYASTTTQQS